MKLSRVDIIRRGGQMWLPTSAERYEAWLATYGGAWQQAMQNRRQLQGYSASFGGSAW